MATEYTTSTTSTTSTNYLTIDTAEKIKNAYETVKLATVQVRVSFDGYGDVAVGVTGRKDRAERWLHDDGIFAPMSVDLLPPVIGELQFLIPIEIWDGDDGVGESYAIGPPSPSDSFTRDTYTPPIPEAEGMVQWADSARPSKATRSEHRGR